MKIRNRTSHRSVTIAALALAGILSAPAQAGPKFSDWSVSAPTGLGGGCPIESRSGNTLFVAGGFEGSLDIFYYERSGRAKAFDPSSRTKVEDPVSKPPTNGVDVQDFCPTPLPGQTLLFVSNRTGDGVCGGTDIYVSRYNPGKDTWSEPRNLGCEPDGPNTAGNELSPSVVKTAAGTLLYFSSGPDAASGYVTGQDIYESRMRVDGSFGPGMAVTELNTDFADRQPNVGRGGLEIVFASNRDDDENGNGDIWYASRGSVFEAWSTPINLSDTVLLTTAGNDESRPSFSWDLKRLYYGSRGVYVSTRKPGK